jgi:hypothetical protein
MPVGVERERIVLVATTAATGGLAGGMRPATHRLQSLGHDPALLQLGQNDSPFALGAT